MNNITTTGNYILTGSITNSYGGTNYGYLQVYRYDNNNIRQVGTPMNSDRMFIRNKYNGTWGNWEELALNSKLTWTRKANLVTSGAYTIPTSASLVLVEVRNTSGGTTFASLVLQADYLPQVFVVYGGSGNQATLSVSGRDISISSVDTGRAVCIYYMG